MNKTVVYIGLGAAILYFFSKGKSDKKVTEAKIFNNLSEEERAKAIKTWENVLVK
jgi:hypothetical protein|tara:strand:- start:675 stop:839 length:165 start_codon:yes stop_codon:yes gene_type:complete